ncbi:hypothetical protein KJ972_04255, partial [Candidatus Micrarchaeota archaeon]|nr:hypothetical protein [Candidatus Micrarchaeota archaeon]
QLLGMQNTGFLPTGASQPPTDSFTIQTNACGGPVTITLESELRLSTKRIQLSGDETSEPIIAFGEENFPGQYGIKLSIQGGGAKNPRQIRTIPVVIHSNPFDCIQMNKFEFNIFKESENSGIDTARVYNYCFDKPVPVLIDQHDLHDALKHGQKTAALGLAMGLMSQLMKGDLLNKIKNPDQEKDKTEDDKKEDKKEETDCDPMPKGADCKGLQIIKKEDGSLKQLPIYKLGSSYFAREGTTIIEVIKEGDKYVPITPPPATPPANPPTDTQPAETASNQTLLPSTTGFQIFGLPYVPESEGYEQTGNPEIDEERRDDAQELADLQLLPTMIGMMGGGNDPFSMALMMYSMGAIQAYASQEDVRYMTIQPDLELGGGILGFLGGGGDMFGFDLGGGIGDALGGIGGFLDSILPFDRQAFSLLKIPAVFESDVFDGINVSEYRRPTFAPRRDNQALSTETAYIKIENTDAVIQEDPLNPLFAVLNVNGTRHIYDRDQAYEEEMPNSLREEGSYKINAKFHLQLNSFKPDTDRGFISNELANCKIGALVGSTGPEAVPRIKLSWNWNEIPINLCDNDNPEYSYCDATQFSIALLQKLQKLREFITVNADTFECPALVSGETVIEQTLSTTAQDIGLTKLEYRKEGNDINFLTTISSNNQLEFNTIVTTTIQETDDNGIPTETVHSCDTPATVLTSQTVSCLAPELENGAYLVTSTLGTITDCQECRNDNTSNDVIFKTMLIGLDQTIVQCDPIETSRLQAFIEATEQSGESITYPQGLNKESTLKLVNFTAHLIKDGFTQDFRNDFDEFASSKAFFQTPAYYSQEDGLGEYFTDPNHFSFEYFGAPSGPIIGPGVYQVQVNIKFEDMGFVWFEGGQPVATIEVSLDKTADASPTSPFYYLPFDGLIGVDNGRNGYGLNYELLTADKPVRINKQVDQLIQLNNILGSNPAGVLKGLFVDDFKSTNHDARGQVMSIDRSTNELKLTPSLATPIVLQVNATSARDAYAFYRTESRGQPQKDFDYLATWNGLGATCKDYYGNDMDIYTEMPDKSGTDAICAIVGSQADTAFGFEWCDKITSGNLYLETILYSPATSSSTLNLIAASNSAKLISKGANGDQIELSGVSGITYNTASNPIGAVEDVLALVKDELVCVSGLDNSQRTEFFWNPKPVLESIQNERDQALETCITG